MSPSGNTLWIAKGFHRVWKEATYRSVKAGYWNRWGWNSCSPDKQFLDEDVRKHIVPNLFGLTAGPGDLIIIKPTIPHGPNQNSSSLRLAAYPYLVPLLRADPLSDPLQLRSFMPNSLASVKNSVLKGACPELEAHPYMDVKVPKISKPFFPLLPARSLPLSLLGECLYGFKSWPIFEESDLAKVLFGKDHGARLKVSASMQKPIYAAFKAWNDTVEKWLGIHESHGTKTLQCGLCRRLESSTMLQWWHSTEAARHRRRGCRCNRCCVALEYDWRMWTEADGCSCYVCNKVDIL
jgi:hypothetical protein